MRFGRIVLPVVALMFLAGCAARDDGKMDAWEWMNGRPSNTEKKLGTMPTGYTGHNKNRPVLKPVFQEPAWNQIEDYQLPEGEGAVVATDPVSVYPVDGASDATLMSMDDYGQLVQQIYFLHGSSHLTSGEKKTLHTLAQGISQNATASVAVTVVGHASKRVDGIADPLRRKMINFEMAQKRANAVTQELNRAGLNPAWVQAVSKGDEEPNVSAGPRTQEAADRRVDLYVNGAQY
ncbi:MAG: OmpA family protein [Alphaproteobacteria bacterium]|nr:OmpA family protein [Alphaproteobacteria bacterium]HRI76288.1 OmpA family protein [Alphaproteobacteria bacterium]